MNNGLVMFRQITLIFPERFEAHLHLNAPHLLRVPGVLN